MSLSRAGLCWAQSTAALIAAGGLLLSLSCRAQNADNADAGVALAVAPGATSAMVALGERIFNGQVGAAGCTACHGAEGGGTPLGPDLSSDHWQWSDGTLPGISAVISKGVAHPKQYRAAMPPKGGAQLSVEQVNAVAAYVWALSHRDAATKALPAQLSLPGNNVFPESLTATSDGRVFIGSVGERQIFLIRSGSATAEAWSEPEANASLGVFGVFADEQRATLWACLSSFKGARAMLAAYDLLTGVRKARYPMPSAGAFCNDIAIGADGSVYVTDTDNMQVVRLKPDGMQLEMWAGNGAFGRRGGDLNGIAIIGSRLFVNTQTSNKLFSVTINTDGTAGAVVEVPLARQLEHPDGMRSYGNSLLLIEGGGKGSLDKITFHEGEAAITAVQQGFPDVPVSVAVVGSTGYVLEGQLKNLGKPEVAKPFKATAVAVGSPP